jgi:hypothetical protein
MICVEKNEGIELQEESPSGSRKTHAAKAYSARSATSGLAPSAIRRRTPQTSGREWRNGCE